MIKIISRTFSYSLSVVLLVTMIGCSRNDAANDTGSSGAAGRESVLIGQFTESLDNKAFVQTSALSLPVLSGYLPNIENVTIIDELVYFTSTANVASDSLEHKTRIFSLDISNRDNPVLVELSGYTVPPPPPDTEAGGVHITTMHIGSDGTHLWVAEAGRFVDFDFPPSFDVDNAEPDEIWEYTRLLESYQTIRKLDSTGAEVLKVDISELSRAHDWVGIAAFNVDADGNVFIGSGHRMYALNANGESLFTLDTSGFVNHGGMIRLQDGSVALTSHTMTGTIELQMIDTANKTWGDTLVLPSDTLTIFPGNEEGTIFCNSRTALYVVELATGDYAQLLRWSDIDLATTELTNFTFVGDEHIMFTYNDYRYTSSAEYSVVTMIMSYSLAELSELPEVVTLTIARAGTDSFATNAIRHFNRTNTKYRIELIDYVDVRGDISGLAILEGRNQLILDIISGSVPDIIALDINMFEELVSSGIFENLYEYIDNDPQLNRSDLMEDVFGKLEVDGALYHIFPFFGVSTISGSSDVLGSNPRWDFAAFRNVIETNPQAAFPMGKFWSFDEYLFSILSIEDLVNWETGTTYFDRDDFSEILKWVKDNYSEDVLVEIDPIFGWFFNTEELIRTGDQIMIRDAVASFAYHAALQCVFGGDVVYKGTPRTEGVGNYLSFYGSVAISSISDNKKGAWEFVRMFLTEEWQQENVASFDNFLKFPTNRAVFQKELTDSMSPDGPEIVYFSPFDSDIEIDPLAQRDVDKVLALIESAVPPQFGHIGALYDIILESVHDYMNGRTSLEDTVRVLQNRAAIFVSERQRR